MEKTELIFSFDTEDFTSNKARVTAIFTFPTESSPVTIVKTLTIKKQS